jgi:hypothetical protein
MNKPLTTNAIANLGALSIVLATAGNACASLVFDNISNYQNSVIGAAVVSSSATPNTFMGDGYILAPGTTSITGFDIYPVNVSGTGFNGLKLTISVWDTVNTSGTVNATTPAFSNLLSTYVLTSAGTFSTGYYFPFEGTPVGSAAGFTLATPLALTDTIIGLSFNYQGTTNNGATYSNFNSLTSLISYGTAPSVGSQVFNGYYRNASSEVNGNFTSSLRSLGQTYQSLAVRVYGDGPGTVPEPSTYALLGISVGMLGLKRRRVQQVQFHGKDRKAGK